MAQDKKIPNTYTNKTIGNTGGNPPKPDASNK